MDPMRLQQGFEALMRCNLDIVSEDRATATQATATKAAAGGAAAPCRRQHHEALDAEKAVTRVG